ncbi:hypothetical protein FB00_17665 [Cellulosimicrobium funkei]|uniref:CU044_5270 family protein n=1 Tax=Cellulosimicrobium funkei TaxID=264251 RepID=A0A0H2KZP6_9MICO|nr:hypothetical protein [Cellulosimicrobium funkei]KLN33417.1 hypothetical protein FB00_17665 [Cellulosimicrobium funkei]
MSDTLTRTDDTFARSLRERVDAAAPRIDVDIARVVPAARRVRRRRRAVVAGVCALAVVTGAGTWAAREHGLLRTEPLLPASVTPYVPDADAPTIDGGWPDAPYWHVRSESSGTDSTGAASHEVRDSWSGNDRPGVVTVEGSPDDDFSFGPRGWGNLLIDGERVMIGWDGLYALPTEPAQLEQLLRASVEPDRGAGSAEDKVFDMARSLLVDSPAPPALRDALWTIMTGLPTSTPLGEVTDSLGRTGEGVQRSLQGQTDRLVYDPVEHRVLESSHELDPGVLEEMEAQGQLEGVILSVSGRTTYLEEGPAEDTPVEPSLEDSGCVAWETC